MNESQKRLLTLRDPALPALPAIFGPESGELLSAALSAVDGKLDSARLAQVSWWPGRSLQAVFRARVSPAGNAASRDERIVVATGASLPEGALQLQGPEGARVALWQMERDPALPGLAVALDAQRARSLLDSLDVPAGPVTTRVRAYRPGRRAVVELQSARQRVFVKVVPPAAIQGLQELHQQMAPGLPVPRSHGWSEEHGLVVLQALPGLTLRQTLLDSRLRVPAADQIPQLLDRLPALSSGRKAPAQAEAAPAAIALLRQLLPEYGERFDALAAAFAEDRKSEARVPVHGDLHEAQIMVQQGAITGLLDIDTAGLGERVDDWATMLGHLAVLREAVPQAARKRIEPLARRLMALADQDTGDPARLRLRIAAVIMGLATGPFRVQTGTWLEETRRRVLLAETWVANARKHANMNEFSDNSQAGLIRA